MSQHFFLDTSALVKYYHAELGSDEVLRIIDASTNIVAISQFSILEFHSQLAMKVRDTRYPTFHEKDFTKVCGLLCYHIVSGKFNVIELANNFVFRAVDLIRDYGCKRNLRHLDAIQLSSYSDYLLLNADAIFVASDKKLLQLVIDLGFKHFDPEIESD